MTHLVVRARVRLPFLVSGVLNKWGATQRERTADKRVVYYMNKIDLQHETAYAAFPPRTMPQKPGLRPRGWTMWQRNTGPPVVPLRKPVAFTAATAEHSMLV